MEIDITAFVATAEPYEFSASRAELGSNAGKITWDNARREASSTAFITADSREEFERWVKGFGSWDREEIATWSIEECNALLIQFISGDLRELENTCPSQDDAPFDWSLARRLSERGVISGSIYPGDDGRVYFYMGS